jgi:hypothetical protein
VAVDTGSVGVRDRVGALVGGTGVAVAGTGVLVPVGVAVGDGGTLVGEAGTGVAVRVAVGGAPPPPSCSLKAPASPLAV